MADKRISQLIERTDIANNDVLPIVASGATTTNKVTISTIQTWMQDNLDVGVTSVGLSMPSAFVVSNSPVTASGNITVTGAGTVAQYIRGDGSLADFPQSAGGGGASVSYYLNGSVSQGTIGGIAYLEMNKTPILAAGTDFTIAADGYIASFITDAGDPGLLEIPAGNWNFETYLSATSGGGSPTFYIELYKVNSGGTATLIASNSATPESISLGTNINPYFSALAVPTTTLALTDRLALRYYVTPAGRTITLHTENSHLCQIITTFTTGLTALNGLTAQVQNFATGTSGTDFNISSAGSTHTFNIPSASATARGLVTTGSQTIAGAKTFSSDASFNLVSIGRGAGNQVSNTRVGDGALNANTTGTSNTAVGKLALLNNTTGSDNTSMGLDSMVSNTTGNNNVAFGSNALRSNNSNANTGIGFYSLYSNTTGSSNVALGSYSLYSNTTATGNTANGYYSLFSNTTGGSNTATGYVALSANTTGNGNTATGAYALENNTTGSNNTAVGQNALENNLVGTWNTAVGFNALQQNTNSSNTAIGHQSLQNNTTGDANFAAGRGALELNTTGRLNTSVGFFSLNANTTGSFNVAVGDDAGRFFLGSGNQNVITNNSVFIGSQTRALGNNQTNQIVIGHQAVGNGSNTVTIGNSSITENYFTGNIRGGAFIRTGGTSSQFLKADGSVDSSTYLTTSSAASTYLPLIGGVLTGGLGGTSASFSGDVQTSTRLVAANPSATITITPNLSGTTNRIEASNLPLEVYTSGSELKFRAGTGNAQVTLASTGAVTLTGALSGTSASFNQSANSNALKLLNTAGYPSIIDLSTNTATSAARNWAIYTNGTNWGDLEFKPSAANGGDPYTTGTVALRISSTGAATFSSSVTAGGNIQGKKGTFGTTGISTPSLLVSDNDQSNVRLRLQNTTSGNAWDLVGGLNAANNSDFSIYDVANNNTVLRIVPNSGNATFSSSVTVQSGNSLFVNNDNNTRSGFLRTSSQGTELSSFAGAGEPLILIAPDTTASMRFYTGGSTSASERMRITSGGQLLVGKTTLAMNTSGIELYPNGTSVHSFNVTNNEAVIFNNIATGTSYQIDFRTNTIERGSISVTDSATSYNTSSDYRLKENVKPVENALSVLTQLKPYTFNFIVNPQEEVMGFLAHEVQEVMPQAIKGEKDAVKIEQVEVSPAELDEEGNVITEAVIEEKEVPVYQGIDHSKLVPLLVASIQELKAEIEALKSQING